MAAPEPHLSVEAFIELGLGLTLVGWQRDVLRRVLKKSPPYGPLVIGGPETDSLQDFVPIGDSVNGMYPTTPYRDADMNVSRSVGQVVEAAYEKELDLQTGMTKDERVAWGRAREAEDSLVDEEALLKQVGWYCAGEHMTESSRGMGQVKVRKASIRLIAEQQCEHAVPVFVLVKNEPTVTFPVFNNMVDRSKDGPDLDYVRNLVGAMVEVSTHSGKSFTGKLKLIDRDNTIHLQEKTRSGLLTVAWSDLLTCEEMT